MTQPRAVERYQAAIRAEQDRSRNPLPPVRPDHFHRIGRTDLQLAKDALQDSAIDLFMRMVTA